MKKTTLFLLALLVVSSIVSAIFWYSSGPLNERPQEPLKPFSYSSEDVEFQNAEANITLAGTLTLPSKKGNYPAVILITGSGAQNRDAEFFGHKPFLIISDYLTKNGIAVLRYDDRGFGKSTGVFISATPQDFASDVESAIAYLKTRKEIDKVKIGLVGHSEGAIVAPIVASRSEDVKFIVLLAGLGIKGSEALMQQSEVALRTSGATKSEIENLKEINAGIADIFSKRQSTGILKAELTKYIQKNFETIPIYSKPKGVTKEQFISRQIEIISSPAYQFIWNYDPATTLEKVACPVLALNGEKDTQVLAKYNLEPIRDALENGNNEDVLVKELPNLNHFFQECKTGSATEYAAIEQTFSPTALYEISNWISEQVR